MPIKVGLFSSSEGIARTEVGHNLERNFLKMATTFTLGLFFFWLMHCAGQESDDRGISDKEWNNSSEPEHFLLAKQDCFSMYECPQPLETRSKVLPRWDKFGCRCDDDCQMYGDCCSNWAAYSSRETMLARQKYKCVKFVIHTGVYVRSTCPEDWIGDEIRKLCEDSSVGLDGDTGDGATKDPLASIPVTSLNTRVTYLNHYCAVCNDDIVRPVYWKLFLECDALHTYNDTFGNVTESYVWQNLRYAAANHTWGVHLDNSGVAFGPFIRNSSFVPCRIVLRMPDTVVDLVRYCYPLIDTCPVQWTNRTVSDLCQSYTAIVFNNYLNGPIFRNIHCAVCNGQKFSDLDCRSYPLYRTPDSPASFAPSFAFLFDVNEENGDIVGTVRRCPLGQLYDPFFRYCRQIVCANSSYALQDGRCVNVAELPTDIPTPTLSGNNTSTDPVGDSSSSNGTTATSPDDNVLDCPLFNISEADYKMFANGSVFVDRYQRTFAPGEYIASIDGAILVCLPMMEGESEDYLYRRKFSLLLAYVTLAGLSISITCLFFHMLAFLLVPSLRNLSGKNLVSLCAVLFVAYIVFIMSQFEDSVSRAACTSMSIVLYYCFLAAFFWMNAIAFDVWRTLRLATSELRVSAGQQWRKFVAYSSYAWLGPAVIVAVSVVMDNSPSTPFLLRPAFGKFACWFGSRRALLIFFVCPVTALLLVNVVLFMLSARIIVGSTKCSINLHPSNNARRDFTLYLRLALIMGLSWVFGIAAGLLDTQPLWYGFVVLNTLQGLFTFLSFTCTKKVRNYLLDHVFCSASSYHSSVQGKTGHRVTNKKELECRDSGSSDSQSSQSSHTTLTNVSSQTSTGRLFCTDSSNSGNGRC